MNRKRLTEILSQKKKGDRWNCYAAPEEFHYWTVKHKWPSLEKYGVAPLSLKASARGSVMKPLKTRFTKKSPKRLNCGIDVTGYDSVIQSRNNGFDFRVDSTQEINQVLLELSEEYEKTSWEISELSVYNPKSGAMVEFARYNPDKTGVLLYAICTLVNGREKYYPEISLSTMQRYLGKFKQKLAHCTLEQVLAGSCAIKLGVKGEQTLLRKNKE